MTITEKEANILEKLSEYSFKIYEYYQKLISLDTAIPKDLLYDEKRKDIIEKILSYKLLEDDIYNQLEFGDTKTIQKLIDFIQINYLNNKNNNIEVVNIFLMSQGTDNNFSISRIFNHLSFLNKKDKPETYNPNIGFLLEEGIDYIDAQVFLNAFLERIQISTNMRQLATFKHEAANMNNLNEKNNLIKKFYSLLFISKKIESLLLVNSLKNIPLNLDEEINVGIIPNKIKQKFLDFFLLDSIKILVNLINELLEIDLTFIIAFKVLLLYISKDGLKEIEKYIEKVDFTLPYMKKILLDEIKYIDINKAYHNKDLQNKKEMN